MDKFLGSEWSRRGWMKAWFAAGASVAGSGLFSQSMADDKSSVSSGDKSPADEITPETQRAIDRGLSWLSKQQRKTGEKRGAFGLGGYAGGVAVCGLSGLAFMCSGSSPGAGPFGKHIDMCVEYLSNCVQENGYISVPGIGMDNMYGHGFATLFLAEAYGMSTRSERDKELGEKLRKAVQLTIDCQNDAGGWRYQPVKSDADLSITICQIMALRAARDAGIDVPDKVRSKCIEYVKKSQNTDGSFRYTLSQGGGGTFPLTAAGVVSLYSAGIYDGEQIDKAIKWLNNHLPGKANGQFSSYFYYGQYYAVQAMWHSGGKNWDNWYKGIREVLLARQDSDGAFQDQEVCPEFGTAMACIILQMPNNFVPIFAP